MGQTVLSLDQNLLERLENARQIEKKSFYLGQYGSNCIASNLVSWWNCLWWNFLKALYEQYGSNFIVCFISLAEFARNIANFVINQTICDFDKDWSKFVTWTVWINRYSAWLKFFKNNSRIQKPASDENLRIIIEKRIWFKLINMVQTFAWSEFATNIAKSKINRTLCDFDKD